MAGSHRNKPLSSYGVGRYRQRQSAPSSYPPFCSPYLYNPTRIRLRQAAARGRRGCSSPSRPRPPCVGWCTGKPRGPAAATAPATTTNCTRTRIDVRTDIRTTCARTCSCANVQAHVAHAHTHTRCMYTRTPGLRGHVHTCACMNMGCAYARAHAHGMWICARACVWGVHMCACMRMGCAYARAHAYGCATPRVYVYAMLQVIVMRHSERADDRHNNRRHQKNPIADFRLHDCPITDTGRKLACDTGRTIAALFAGTPPRYYNYS